MAVDAMARTVRSLTLMPTEQHQPSNSRSSFACISGTPFWSSHMLAAAAMRARSADGGRPRLFCSCSAFSWLSPGLACRLAGMGSFSRRALTTPRAMSSIKTERPGIAGHPERTTCGGLTPARLSTAKAAFTSLAPTIVAGVQLFATVSLSFSPMEIVLSVVAALSQGLDVPDRHRAILQVNCCN